jgi:hypothetical protein
LIKEVPAGEIADEEIQTTYDQYAKQGKAANQEVPTRRNETTNRTISTTAKTSGTTRAAD